MPTIRIALANVRLPSSSDESLAIVLATIDAACVAEAAIVCFPECYLPGYLPRGMAVSRNRSLGSPKWGTSRLSPALRDRGEENDGNLPKRS